MTTALNLKLVINAANDGLTPAEKPSERAAQQSNNEDNEKQPGRQDKAVGSKNMAHPVTKEHPEDEQHVERQFHITSIGFSWTK